MIEIPSKSYQELPMYDYPTIKAVIEGGSIWDIYALIAWAQTKESFRQRVLYALGVLR